MVTVTGTGSSKDATHLPRRPVRTTAAGHVGVSWPGVGSLKLIRTSSTGQPDMPARRVRDQMHALGTVKLVSGAAEADDPGVDTQPEGPSWARCRTRVTGIRRRSSRIACGCITGYR